MTENYTFDAQSGLLTNQTAVKNGSTPLLDLSYDYNRNNSNGNLNGKTGHLTKVIDNVNTARNREYQFDAVGRLTVAKGKASNQWTQTYTYDRFGNRTSVAATGTAVDGSTMVTDGIPSLAFDTASNRITTTGFQYDAAGNQTRALAADGATWVKYEYDAANRLQYVRKDDQTLLQGFTFGSSNSRLIDYDAAGTGRNTFYAAVGGTVLAEYTEYTQSVQSWTKSYTYLGDSQLSTITPNGMGGEYTEYNHPDRLGTRLITSQSAGTSYEQAHLPFGKILDSETTVINNNKRFTSYDRSSITGLDYAINRTYDSKLGRFSQVDPIGMQAVSLSAPQTLNLYSYCGNDPINHTDPSGLFWGSLFKWIAKAFKILAIAVAVAIVIMSGPFAPASGSLLANILSGIIWLGAKAGLATNFLAGGTLLVEGAAGGVVASLGAAGLIVAGTAVGAIANQFRQGARRNPNRIRRAAITEAVLKNALWRLRKKPECAKYVQGNNSENPADSLEKIYGGGLDNNNLLYGGAGSTGQGGTVDPGAIADTPLNHALEKKGSSGTIFLNDEFFNKSGNVGGWTQRSTMNTINARTMIMLHELRHLNGIVHRPGNPNDPESNLIFNQQIAKHCFGVKFD